MLVFLGIIYHLGIWVRLIAADLCVKSWRRSAKQSGPLLCFFLWPFLSFTELFVISGPSPCPSQLCFSPMMTEFSGLYCCGLSVFTSVPTGAAVQLRSVFAIPTEFSTAVVCFYCPARLYSMWPRTVFTVPTEFSTAVREFVFTVPTVSPGVSEFSTARHWIQYCGCGLFSLSPDGIEYSFVFRPTPGCPDSIFIGDWAIGTLTLSGLADLWLTDSVDILDSAFSSFLAEVSQS